MKSVVPCLLLLITPFAGCLEGNAPAQDVATESRTHFILVQESFWVNATGNGTIYANLGPHCENASYSLNPPSVTIFNAGNTIPSGILIQDIERDPAYPPHFRSEGSGLKLYAFSPQNGTLTVASAFEENRPLIELRFQDGRALVNGTALAEGDTRNLRHAFTVQAEGGPYHVTEVLTIRNIGQAGVSLKAPPPNCA